MQYLFHRLHACRYWVDTQNGADALPSPLVLRIRAKSVVETLHHRPPESVV